MREIHWAVLGTGVIANEMATALEKNGKKLYAVGNRTYEKAVKFGEKYGIKKVFTDFNEMFTDPEVDVIYITTPHNTHIQFMKKAIENGKHILVEKSITLNSEELDEALERAIQGEQSGNAQMVCEAAAHIGRLAETYDLRVLDDPARCLEEVACSGNMDEIVQLMPDLVSAINRNRASFEEAERDG